MSLATNTTTMQTILEKLQGKASGGSGVSVDTCTINKTSSTRLVSATTISNGVFSAPYITYSDNGTLENVVCGSSLVIVDNRGDYSIPNGLTELCFRDAPIDGLYILVCQVTANANDVITI